MDNFISPELKGLCLFIWALIGIGFIWYVHKIKTFNLEPELHQELEEAGGDIEANLLENPQVPVNDVDPYEASPNVLDRPTHQ